MEPFLVESVLESKQDIRRRLKALRQRLAPEAVRDKSAQIACRVQALTEYRDAACVLVYLALPQEVQTDAVIAAALQAGKRLFVPVVVPGKADLLISPLTDPAAVAATGPFGIRQPSAESGPPASPEILDLVLAPGLAFDRRGHRLGFGKGYFDRLFAQLPPPCRRVGLAFDFQVLEDVPATAGDRPVHRVITERETIDCGL